MTVYHVRLIASSTRLFFSSIARRDSRRASRLFRGMSCLGLLVVSIGACNTSRHSLATNSNTDTASASYDSRTIPDGGRGGSKPERVDAGEGSEQGTGARDTPSEGNATGETNGREPSSDTRGVGETTADSQTDDSTADAATEPACGSGGNAGGSGSSGDCPTESGRCFEPCGGDPSGNWILEAGCLSGAGLGEDCVSGAIDGTLVSGNLRLSIDGQHARVSGEEVWDFRATIPRSCLGMGDTRPCNEGSMFTQLLPFAQTRSLITCQSEAGESCECAGPLDRYDGSTFATSTDGDLLTLTREGFQGSSQTVQYCVEGDVLWLGQHNGGARTMTAYKFRKRSCRSTMAPCGERTQQDCESTTDCRWGACVPKVDSVGFCEGFDESQCATDSDCRWIAEQCAGTGGGGCDFHLCEEEAYCRLGPSVGRCVGGSWCTGYDLEACTEPGCAVVECAPRDDGYDKVPCYGLTAGSCANAPGCTSQAGQCREDTRCTAQTDEDVCSDLLCQRAKFCAGRPVRGCSSLSVQDCSTLNGCSVEW